MLHYILIAVVVINVISLLFIIIPTKLQGLLMVFLTYLKPTRREQVSKWSMQVLFYVI